jgi:hypothetical protein
MDNNRQKTNVSETVKNAASGYGVVVLGTICFLLSLAVLSAVVRIIVGASAGA